MKITEVRVSKLITVIQGSVRSVRDAWAGKCLGSGVCETQTFPPKALIKAKENIKDKIQEGPKDPL